MNAALGLIRSAYPANVEERSCLERALLFTFGLNLPDGDTITFDLRVEAHVGGGITVRERQAKRLPAFCPERHINSDGTFCLGYGDEVLASGPRTLMEAQRWWETMGWFLRLQYLAEVTGQWKARAWPHGEAAKYQQEIESLMERLPRAVLGARESAAASRNPLIRPQCPCLSGKSFDACHREDLLNLTTLERRRDAAERAYSASLDGRSCCGTMRHCVLASRR